MRRGVPVVCVRDRTLVACLLTAGARLDPGDEISSVVGDGNLSAWNFLERTETGESVINLKHIFERDPNPATNEWVAKNSSHEFAVAWIAIHNRQWVQARDKERIPSVMIKRGSSFALLDPKLSQKRTDIILQKIGV